MQFHTVGPPQEDNRRSLVKKSAEFYEITLITRQSRSKGREPRAVARVAYV